MKYLSGKYKTVARLVQESTVQVFDSQFYDPEKTHKTQILHFHSYFNIHLLVITPLTKDIIITLKNKMTSIITDLVKDYITDGRQAFRLVHTGIDKLAAQEEVPVVPLLLF